jgi:fluoride exporter
MAAPALIPHDAIALGIGAFMGVMSRYQVGRLAGEWIATDPNRLVRYAGWHTAAINIAGSFLFGVVSATPLVKKADLSFFGQSAIGLSQRSKLLLGVGFCGSFTTFSTFSVDVVTWIAQGQSAKAVSYVAANNVGGVLAASLGIALVKKCIG